MYLWLWHEHDSLQACDANISHPQGIVFDIDSTHASATDLKRLVMAFHPAFMKNMFTADPNCCHFNMLALLSSTVLPNISFWVQHSSMWRLRVAESCHLEQMAR